jgi:WD40 repeat protein
MSFGPKSAGRRFSRRVTAIAIAALATAAMVAPASGQAATRDVVAVGNAFGGTVSFLDGSTFANLGSINVVPDLATRKLTLFINPITLVGYNVVKSTKGGENYVDDVATSPDGKTLYVSRGILEDVAAFDIKTKKMLWRKDIGGFEADHMALSPDGTKLVVSDTTNGVEKVFNPSNGAQLGSYAAGTYSHDVEFSADGKHIYSGSIGTVPLPYALNSVKGDKQLTIADANTYQVIKTYKFPYGLRPDILTPDEKYYFFQQSYNRGFVEFNLTTGAITRRKTDLPATAAGDALFPDKLPANSMHHGLALSGDGTKICNAGTIDNYVAIVNRSDFSTLSVTGGFAKPYWAETSKDGNYCLVSNSDGDSVWAVNYATGAIYKKTTVGDYPQRVHNAKLDTDSQSGLSSAAG